MKLKAHYTTFWGKRYRVTPRLITKTFGDGKQVIGVQPLDTRPDYYVVCIDSKTDLDSDEFHDLLDGDCGIYDAIENQFGRGTGVRGGYYPFPSLHCGSGCTWWEFKEAPAGLVEAQKLLATAALQNSASEFVD